MPKPLPTYVLDSYAFLAYLQAEAGGPSIHALLETARDRQALIGMSLINVGEVYYILHRERGADRAEKTLRDLRALPISLYLPTEERILAAARIKAHFPLAYADAFAAALAQELHALLVTGDPEFESVEPQVTIMWLPRK
jgi:predicted nucleic acid-binding protein